MVRLWCTLLKYTNTSVPEEHFRILCGTEEESAACPATLTSGAAEDIGTYRCFSANLQNGACKGYFSARQRWHDRAPSSFVWFGVVEK